MALFSPPLPTSLCPKPRCFSIASKPAFFTGKSFSALPVRCSENGAGAAAFVALEVDDEKKKNAEGETVAPPSLVVEVKKEVRERVEDESLVGLNGAAESRVSKFADPRWIGGTWDLKQFLKDGRTDWDAVIDAEAGRRKWFEDNPQASSNDDPVIFRTSIIPWWSWVKRFHLPEAELLNGRAAMLGFFMAYLVDSLTGVGLVDQMSNVFCKTLLFIVVVGVLVIRKNEDLETVKKIIDETTFYDKQWQAAWKDDSIINKG